MADTAENDAPAKRPCACYPCRAGFRVAPPAVSLAESVCFDCGMPGQCAACYLMESRGIPTPPRVIPPA